MIGPATTKIFKWILKSNQIRNCPVTTKDVEIAEDIWGPDLSYLKGKTTRSTPKPVVYDNIDVPKEIYEKHKDIELCMDTIYINGSAFLTTIGYPIYYRECRYVKDTSHTEYFKIIDKSVRQYNAAGFRIKVIECDGEYKQMMDKVKDDMDVTMNYSNAQDHVPRTERNN